MSLAAIGLLISMGFVAVVLLQEIRRVERRLNEATNNLQRASERIAALEKEVKSLKR